MNEKLRESIQYLKHCTVIENETFKLYETLSKKINQPESSSILGIAYDSLKNAKIIQGILDCFDLPESENKNDRKDLSELAEEIMMLEKRISKINSIDYLVSCEILKESINLEVLLTEIYTNYLKSNSTRIIVDELSKTVMVSFNNFKKVIEYFIEEKGKHRETIVEIMYQLETKETEAHRQITPLIKYQNPDAWIHESTIHSFSNGPITGNTEP
jgi:hypothetical protein